ncbi:MAG: helix-hairpin-helix domain-containing protein [Oscillospiraceae bacterium]|nr:helix-hairpin-helix domain-containing protein [Oscillospiraceae bacterium]
MDTGKQIRVLLSVCLLFCVLILGCNLFFTKEPAETILLTDVSESASSSAVSRESAAVAVSEAEAVVSSASAEPAAQSHSTQQETPATADGGKVNLNTADAAELETLYRIGPTLAQRIIEYREANGGFRSIEELTNVSGIGEKIFAAIQEDIEVD